MNNLKSLLLTEGAHGMISQTEGLAISLQTDFNHQFVKMNNILKYFPPKILPISSITFNFVKFLPSFKYFFFFRSR